MFIVRCIRCCSLFLAVSFILCTLASCMGKTEDKEPEQKSEGLANQFKDEGDDAVSQSSGMIGYGFADGSPDEYTNCDEGIYFSSSKPKCFAKTDSISSRVSVSKSERV